jgi:hypothetical protein
LAISIELTLASMKDTSTSQKMTRKTQINIAITSQ